jgi:hypothetical protein
MRNGHHIHFRASLRDCEQLSLIAEEDGTTTSAILRRLIRVYVRQRDQQRQQPAVAPRPADPRYGIKA